MPATPSQQLPLTNGTYLLLRYSLIPSMWRAPTIIRSAVMRHVVFPRPRKKKRPGVEHRALNFAAIPRINGVSLKGGCGHPGRFTT